MTPLMYNNLPKIRRREWKIIEAASTSRTVREISKKTKISPSTVKNILERLREKGSLRYVPNYLYFGFIPLAVICDFDEELSRLHITGTLGRRILYGLEKYILFTALIPVVFVDEYTRMLDAKKIVVKGTEYLRWRPDLSREFYNQEKEVLEPCFKKCFSLIDSTPKNYGNQYIKPGPPPDHIDLAILTFKLARGPFIKLSEVIRLAASIDPIFDKAYSRQTLSYHYRKHVIPGWRYNSFSAYLPLKNVPMKILYFKGREAPLLARVLIRLPYFYSAFIDGDTSLIAAQIPCSFEEEFYNFLSVLDVDMPLGVLIQSSKDINRLMPFLWKFVGIKDNYRFWRWPEIKVKEVTSRQYDKSPKS